jgi:hypothetical protein
MEKFSKYDNGFEVKKIMKEELTTDQIRQTIKLWVLEWQVRTVYAWKWTNSSPYI